MVLHRRTRAPSQDTLHYREIELSLTDDGRYLILSRYVELYNDEQTVWCSVRHHRVPLTAMVRWITNSGTGGEAQQFERV